MISLGSKSENLGLIVENSPDQVTVGLCGSAWEKDKLVLRLQRDSDKKVMVFFDVIARGLYESLQQKVTSNTKIGSVHLTVLVV